MNLLLILPFACLSIFFFICYVLCLKTKNEEIQKRTNDTDKTTIDLLNIIGRRLRLRAAVLQERLKKEIRKEVYDKYIINEFLLPEAYPQLLKTPIKNDKLTAKMIIIEKYSNIIAYYEDLLYFFGGLADEDEKFDILDIYEDAEAELAIEIFAKQKNIERLNKM